MSSTLTASPILNDELPARPWCLPQAGRLPGIAPIEMSDWLWQLDTYAAQMAERERLLEKCPEKVLALQADARPAAEELFDLVLAQLETRPGFVREAGTLHCPDGRSVALDRSAPLRTLGRLVQEDLCLLVKPEGDDEHLLAGAVLCFPASWTLAEKIGRPMLAIHIPVEVYDETLARRVQRLLDGVRPDRPLARSNAFFYDDPALFQPRPELDPRPAGGPTAAFFRSERQCLIRLPESGAVAFSIHTILLARSALTVEDRAALGT
ncbi:DUF3445 domain-containing protein [Tropicimonas sp. TH_r6]|uniref:heme-dependent oxidative N-demethylase family protein n=1 Tax=Tropicimonas sp. TH_r6 TaxID=3082085 RepID=UPI00295527D7|nr:DUF3445 domain-containing protein [Tropicimonas sp. TH_r6]MDV7143818.1 DUF3445 domain-containing protein [Tropicimonas sp. TH_r6]